MQVNKKKLGTALGCIGAIIITPIVAVVIFYASITLMFYPAEDFFAEYTSWYPSYNPKKPTEFIRMPNMTSEYQGTRNEHFIVKNPPRDPVLFLNEIRAFNEATLSPETLLRYGTYTRGFHLESKRTSIDFQEDQTGFYTDYLNEHHRDFLLEITWRPREEGKYMNLLIKDSKGTKYAFKGVELDSIYSFTPEVIENYTVPRNWFNLYYIPMAIIGILFLWGIKRSLCPG